MCAPPAFELKSTIDKRKWNTLSIFSVYDFTSYFPKKTTEHWIFFLNLLRVKSYVLNSKNVSVLVFWFIDNSANKSSSKQKVIRLFIAGSGDFFLCCFRMIYGSISFSVELSLTLWEIAIFYDFTMNVLCLQYEIDQFFCEITDSQKAAYSTLKWFWPHVYFGSLNF